MVFSAVPYSADLSQLLHATSCYLLLKPPPVPHPQQSTRPLSHHTTPSDTPIRRVMANPTAQSITSPQLLLTPDLLPISVNAYQKKTAIK